MSAPLPQLVAFDLDYTLWDLWIDTHVTKPLKRTGQEINRLTDKHKNEIAFYPEVPRILHDLVDSGVHIAACSRTHAPDLARTALSLLLIPPAKTHSRTTPREAISFFDTMEIYPGSKLKHFRELHKKTGIAYEDMLFFDDESRNREVEQLGVTFTLVRTGMDWNTYQGGLKEWRRRHPVEDEKKEEGIEEESEE